MPAPKRRHPARPSAPPAPEEPLGTIVREYEQWRRSQAGKPGRGALREYWVQRDRKHGQRPDYALWRQTQCPESPPEKRLDPMELAVKALRAPDAQVHWAALALVAGRLQGQPPRREDLLKAVQARLGSAPLNDAPLSCALVRWLCRVAIRPEASLNELQEVIVTFTPGWKPGRAADLSFLKKEAWVPVPPSSLVREVVAAIQRLAPDDAIWQLTGWMMLRDLRPAGSSARVDELEALLRAAQTARLTGDAHAATRLLALFMQVLPPKMPEPLLNRARVAAWTLAEAGLAAPQGLRVSLDDLPFPGDTPMSEKGLEAARLFYDEADPWRKILAEEVTTDPEWQRLREGGVALHHPLAALAWIGKKAQSYVVKKQHDLLRAAVVLAMRHHCLSTAGKILAQAPMSVEMVMTHAKAMRESQRRMPLLRDAEAWAEWTANLRGAWGRLETDAITDPEAVFFLHETLLDREVTVLRSLPMDLRLLALRHVHSKRSPSALVQALEADPRLMQQLEHQRTVELWSVASNLRERPDQTGAMWVSLVLRGDLASGKYSLLIQGTAGRVQSQGRVKDDWKAVAGEIAKGCEAAEWVYLALDSELREMPWETLLRDAGLTAKVALVPSWEWAFRVLREAAVVDEVAPEVLVPEGVENAETPQPMVQTCVLLGGPEMRDANTRWVVAGAVVAEGERRETRRSLAIGEHRTVISRGPLRSGPLAIDLVRLSLAQATRSVIMEDMDNLQRVRGLMKSETALPRQET